MSKINKNRPGYKETKVGWIPEVWKTLYIKDITKKITDGEHVTPKRTSKGYYLLSARNIKNGVIDLSNVDFVAQEEYLRIRKRCDPEVGDILISCSGTIGRVCVVPPELEFVMVRSGALVKKNTKQFNSMFLYNYLISQSGQKQMLRSLNKGAQPNLFINHIQKLKIPIPPLSEQKKIAEILSTWDLAIEKQRKLIELKEKRKKGLMQQLLTGKKRLPGFGMPWTHTNLGELIKSVSRPIEKPNHKYLSLGIRSHCKGIFHKIDFDPAKIMMVVLFHIDFQPTLSLL